MDERRAGVLLVGEAGPGDGWLADARADLEERGYAAATLAVDAGLGDRDAAARIDSALDGLAGPADEERLAAIGFGALGTQVFLYACTRDRLAAAALFDAPLAREELSAEHPFQPLEMALNLSAPVFARFGAEGDESAARTAGLLEEVGSRFARDFDIVADPESPPRAWERSWTELSERDRFTGVREELHRFLAEHLTP